MLVLTGASSALSIPSEPAGILTLIMFLTFFDTHVFCTIPFIKLFKCIPLLRQWILT